MTEPLIQELPNVQRKCRLVICSPCCVVPNGVGGTRLEHVSMQWHRARTRLTIPFGYNASELACDGYEVGEARTRVVTKCREAGAEWLFFLDTDVLPPPNAFKQLLYRSVTHPDYDVFSGVYTVKEHPAIPIIYKNWGEGPCWDWKIGDVIAPVVGAPMGCALLRLSLFDKIENTPEMPWFKTQDLGDGNPLDPEWGVNAKELDIRGAITEDLWFARRAADAGIKILVDTAVQCGHQNLSTGEIYTLPEDCPPVVRSGIKPLPPEKEPA